MRTFNFKAPQPLLDAMREAAAAANLNVSEWARAHLEDAVLERDGVIMRVPTPPRVAALVAAAVAASTMDSTEFTVEALEAAARRELDAARRSTNANHPERTERCTHPLPARRQVVNRVLCSSCGKTLRTL